MISPYVQSKIKEVLAGTKGKATATQDKLMELALNDELLLRGLTTPYLKGIIAHAVARVTGQAVPVPSSDYAKNLIKDEIPESESGRPSAMDKLLSHMSNNINKGKHLSEAGSKEKHADIIRTLAAAQAKKKSIR